MDLNDYRLKIDAIDKELLRLFSERMDVASEIARFKAENGNLYNLYMVPNCYRKFSVV